MQMKPKLLVLTSTFPRWRNDTDPPFVFELSRRLTSTFDVTVHAPHYPGAKTRETMDGMYIYRFRYFLAPFEKLAGSTGIMPTLQSKKLFYGLIPFFLMAQFFSLALLIYRKRPDIIHAHWIIPQGFLSVFVQQLFGIPVVTTAHGTDIFGLQGVFPTFIKKITVTRAAGVTVVSRALTSAVDSIAGKQVNAEVIPMGVNSSKFCPDKRDDLIRIRHGIEGPFLLFVGRLTEVKGLEFLIDAIPLILHKFSDLRLIVIGNGEQERELRTQATERGLDSHVYFLGSLPNSELPAYYATADVFIGPSIRVTGGVTEGFGLTFVEAAMSGCPVIGTMTGGIGEIIKDNETGFLVPERDSVSLAEKITYILTHDMEIQRIKEDAMARCLKKYDWKVIANRYEKFFIQCINF